MKTKIYLISLIAGMLAIAMLSGGYDAPAAASSLPDGLEKVEQGLLDELAAQGRADWIVRFVEQADLSLAYQMEWQARGEFRDDEAPV